MISAEPAGTTPAAAKSWPWVACALLVLASAAPAAQFTIQGPTGSGEFGSSVTTLPNGNIVVTDPGFDADGPIADVGAVYLYGPNGTLISTLRGSSAYDFIGNGGVMALPNGNYLVSSPDWDNGVVANAGAVTFGSGTDGIGGVVSAANSLVGSAADDRVGNSGSTVLSNGSYVVRSSEWDNGTIANAGAVTFGSGVSGVSGVVSSANSLVGGTASDFVGGSGVTALSNGNYVVASSLWDNGPAASAGAVTFGSGVIGISGAVSPANSLVGSAANDFVGRGVTALSNGSYAVVSPDWDNGAIANTGAVTFGSGVSGISGVVSPANSLVGSAANDEVGKFGVTVLSNGNYVVLSPFWDNGPILNAGAVTFGSNVGGIAGLVSPANSLVGSAANDFVGSDVTALSNGNYVVPSPEWDNGAIANAGAVTFGAGTSGVSGVVSPANSLVGSTAIDRIGLLGVVALSNGNYVVKSPFWDNGSTADAGAATFSSGVSGISGVVSPANSLVGSTARDFVSEQGVVALSNGNYVVSSSKWDSGLLASAGAVTFGSGVSGVSGVISPANSLVGGAANDFVGGSGVTALSDGNYVVISPDWDNGPTADAGAATFGSGVSGISGVVSPANSLVGSAANDAVGSFGVTVLSNGNYVVRSPVWDNGPIGNAGALTFGSGVSGIVGVVSPANSLVGSTASDLVGNAAVTALSNGNYIVDTATWDNGPNVNAGAVTLGLSNGSVTGPITTTHSVLGNVTGTGSSQRFSYDPVRNQLAVGQPASNRVVLHRTGIATAISIVGDSPDPSVSGQSVTFIATVSAAPNAPTNGQVTFAASSGESCIDTTPTPTSATTVDFSCTIAFIGNGTASVVAEYTGSIIYAYSGSDPETHTTIADLVFANGLEIP